MRNENLEKMVGSKAFEKYPHGNSGAEHRSFSLAPEIKVFCTVILSPDKIQVLQCTGKIREI
jgi:hypothetical protein